MYAVFVSGGQQHRVKEGDVVRLEKLEHGVGEAVTFDQVLMVVDGDNVQVGEPLVAGAQVAAEVVEQLRGRKVNIIKFRRRKHHMKHMGHRQYYTKVKVTKISG